ncbi:conserved Plasmodium protein, unknown function [Plasmodium malariae]|uniref:JAB1/MPN/MOV34 metalloenzyme domain-containing protein n=2 Tax=Plasmodium (Plasmodium) TaxID=418103 RepID=A0A1D3RJ16_PLAMA|nr:conserved Plasmodium protein, unknown function [Plasmodium malariae]SCN45007.1 conserved Plasmodium protein, unknown function [Plasmodium malariae]
MKRSILLLIYFYLIFTRIKCECLKINKITWKHHFCVTNKPYFCTTSKSYFCVTSKPNFCTISKSDRKRSESSEKSLIHNKNNDKNDTKKLSENKKEKKFLHFRNNKKVSVNPLFDSLCRSVSVSETCLYNVQNFFNEVNYNNLKNKNLDDNNLFCGILYGKYEENNEIVKIENVFFSMNNKSEQNYDVNYLLYSEDRKRADLLAKMLGLEVVGFLYAYPDIGIDISMSNKKKKNFIKLNKKMKMLNYEDNELFIPMGGKEVLLSLMVMKEVLNKPKVGDKLKEGGELHQHEKVRNEKHSSSTNEHTIISAIGVKRKKGMYDDNTTNEHDKKQKSLKKKKIPNAYVKPFITLTVGMNKNSESIIVEAYEINYDLLKLINNDMIKDMRKQNSILQFEKKNNEKEMKIKNFDSEIDIMNELYLKCKDNVLIKKMELKKIDVLFCVNNVPIFSHKSSYNYFFPYPSNTNYYNILQKFNNMIKTLRHTKDIVHIFRDLNFLFFLTNIFSIEHDMPHICKAVNNLNDSTKIPDQYIQILKNLSKNANSLA